MEAGSTTWLSRSKEDVGVLKGAIANIPPKANRRAPPPFDAELYKQRNLIERFFNKIKHFRRIATRYEKHASNYLAMIKLASIRIWMRDNESMA